MDWDNQWGIYSLKKTLFVKILVYMEKAKNFIKQGNL